MQNFRRLVFISLLVSSDVVEQVIGEGGLLRVSIHAAAAELAHESGEGAGHLLNDEEDEEDANSSRVQDCVDLGESIAIYAGDYRNTDTNELGVILKEFDRFVLLPLTSEDGWVGNHVQTHEQVHDKGPFDNGRCLMSQI